MSTTSGKDFLGAAEELISMRVRLQWLHWRPLCFVILGLAPFGLAAFGSAGGVAAAILWAFIYTLVTIGSVPAFLALFRDVIRAATGRETVFYVPDDDARFTEAQRIIRQLPRPARLFMETSFWMNPLSLCVLPAMLFIRLRAAERQPRRIPRLRDRREMLHLLQGAASALMGHRRAFWGHSFFINGRGLR